MNARVHSARLMLVTAAILIPGAVRGDPLPGEQLVFEQRPMVELTTINDGKFYGHDELSTVRRLPLGAPFDVYTGAFMADDFAVKSGLPITHVRFWGSYLQNARLQGIDRFFVIFESDVPTGPNIPFSRPGEALLTQIVTLGPLAPLSGTFTETIIHPGGAPLNENLYEYNAELAAPFVPLPDTVYWLKVAAITEIGPAPLINWGWHNRDYTRRNLLAPVPPQVFPGERQLGFGIPENPPVWHFQDDAVTGQARITDLLTPTGQFQVEQTEVSPTPYLAGVDGPVFIGQFSKDLAFELYSIPEPGTLVTALVVAAGFAWFAVSRRKFRVGAICR
jgi:hypothetical protein